MDSISARSARRPGLSQKDCFPGKGCGGERAYEDREDRYYSKNVSVGQDVNDVLSLRGTVLAAEAKKAGIASNVILITPVLHVIIIMMV